MKGRAIACFKRWDDAVYRGPLISEAIDVTDI